jgi:hypothetical protein
VKFATLVSIAAGDKLFIDYNLTADDCAGIRQPLPFRLGQMPRDHVGSGGG